MYLCQSIALFCHNKTHFICKTLHCAYHDGGGDGLSVTRCLSTSPASGRCGSWAWLPSIAPSLCTPQLCFWVFSGRKHGCVFPTGGAKEMKEGWQEAIGTEGSFAEQPRCR